jgi:hypothetical protein
MTGAIVATAIVFFPAAPLFLFMHGKDIKRRPIPKGMALSKAPSEKPNLASGDSELNYGFRAHEHRAQG